MGTPEEKGCKLAAPAVNDPLLLCQESIQPQSESGFPPVVDAQGLSGVRRTEGSARSFLRWGVLGWEEDGKG